MNHFSKNWIFVIVLLCAITLLACDLGSNSIGAKPDLVVQEVSLRPGQIQSGRAQDLVVEWKILNQGNADAKLFKVRIKIDGVDPAKPGCLTFEVQGLAAGAEKTMNENVEGRCPGTVAEIKTGYHAVTVIADTDNWVEESNEGNNTSKAVTLNVAR